MDGLLAEVFKAGSPNFITKLTQLFQNIWSKRLAPQEFRDALTLLTFKQKGDHSVCVNHHGVSLLSIPGNILRHVILPSMSMT